MIGTQLAHYRITGELGAGGMGEVWRAEDTKLGREVALKVLPADVAGDPERLARFEREAKVLASLNHPNIAHLYGLETVAAGGAAGRESSTDARSDISDTGSGSTGTRRAGETSGRPSTAASPDDASAQDGNRAFTFLVMELVDGEDLSDRIARGAMPVDEAIPIALQIAEALETAHEAGIVHRDLKPANIKLAADGTVKVLDFGLAKAWEADTADTSLSWSPTVTQHATAAGVILGTAAYMSPEQARGKKVDRRADIWAFGVVLWEMLTGHKLFDGETVSDVMAAVLTKTPDTSHLPAPTPDDIRRLVDRCLRGDPRRRMRDMGDVRIHLEESSGRTDQRPEEVAGSDTGRAKGTWLPWLLMTAATVVAIALAWLLLRSTGPRGSDPAYLALTLPDGLSFSLRELRPVVAISPLGEELVLTASDGQTSRLYRRSLRSSNTVPLEGTEGATAPFFSPDGRWVGFTSSVDGRIKKLSLESGQVVALADGDWGGGSWGEDGTIVYTPNYLDGLWRVSAAAGPAEELTRPDPEVGELNHSWPDHVPGTDAVIFTSFRLPLSESRIELLDTSSGMRRLLVEDAVFARYTVSGFLLFVREGVVMAAPFDRRSLSLAGPPVPVIEDAFVAPFEGNSQFSVSDTGTLVHASASLLQPPREVVWIDREGREEVVLAADRRYQGPKLSPDGKSVALTVEDGNPDVWIYRLDRKVLNRLTFSSRSEHTPLWFPDGRRLAFVVDAPPFHLYTAAADGSGEPEPLLESAVDSHAETISPDGRWLVVRQATVDGNADLGVMALDGSSGLRPLRDTKFQERFASLSPDGRYLAYESDESGRPEVYIQSFPETGVRLQVTRDGGEAPLWVSSAEIFFWRDDGLYVVAVDTSGALDIGEPELLFTGRRYETNLGRDYDVTADGRRVIFARIPEAAKPREAAVVLNWFSELERLAGQGSRR